MSKKVTGKQAVEFFRYFVTKTARTAESFRNTAELFLAAILNRQPTEEEVRNAMNVSLDIFEDRSSIFFQPKGKSKGKGRTYSVYVQEDEHGDIVLSVGGMPVLYLSPKTRKLHIVPNDVDEDTGLLYDENKHVQIVWDKER